MDRTLRAHPDTTFVWAHVDHEFYWDAAIQLMQRHKNLVCEFGVLFRFLAADIVHSDPEPHLKDHMDRWRRTCKRFPDRVVWGSDLYCRGDLEPERFSLAMQAWDRVMAPMDATTRRQVTGGNIARILNLPA